MILIFKFFLLTGGVDYIRSDLNRSLNCLWARDGEEDHQREKTWSNKFCVQWAFLSVTQKHFVSKGVISSGFMFKMEGFKISSMCQHEVWPRVPSFTGNYIHILRGLEVRDQDWPSDCLTSRRAAPVYHTHFGVPGIQNRFTSNWTAAWNNYQVTAGAATQSWRQSKWWENERL